MFTIEDFKRMSKDELKSLLLKASDSYYNKSESIISDEEYDIGYNYFITKYPDNDLVKLIGSKIRVTEWKKEKHNIPMYSLNKVNTEEEFKKWVNNIGDIFYILEEKLDGISISLNYINGDLISAITRGDGYEGENIFNNVIKMKNVYRKINNFTGSLRGEIIMFINDFEKLNEKIRNNGGKELSNPRNSASGIAKRYDGINCEYLTILYYDVTGNWLNEEEKLFWLNKNNLKTCFWIKCNIDQCIEYYNQYENKLRAEIPYDIDGLVIKANSIKLQNQCGLLGHNPKAQIAWKFTNMKVETEIEGIEWSHGQNMRITPIALLKPVKIGGVIVRRASLHSMEIFNNLNLGKGDKVLISRRNDVIPYVEKVISHISHIKFKPPIYCPLCNEELTEKDNFLICENTECKGLRIGNLKKWVNALNIDDISDKTIELLERAGVVKDPSDFYKLDINVMVNLEGMGNKIATKIINNFQKNREIDLATFIDGLNISNFSKLRAEDLIKNGIDTLDKMLNITEEELIKIKGIGTEVASSIIYGLSLKRNVINKLLNFITIKEVEKSDIKICSNKLYGQVFVFTGSIQRTNNNGKKITRKMLQDLVYKNGGNCSDSINKNVTILVQADPNIISTKTKKALSLGIKIISEDDFFKMVEM